MRPLAPLLRQGNTVTIRAARQSQALVILAVDRLAHLPGPRRPAPLGRLWGLPLGTARLMVEDPVLLVDETYGLAEQLLNLHREFAHRLLEAIDS